MFLFHLLGLVGGVASLVAWIMILIHAFQDEWWKGLLCLLCWPYLVYYMFVEFQHENKGTIIVVYWVGGFIAGFPGVHLLHHHW